MILLERYIKIFSTMVSLTQYTKICYSGHNMILLAQYTKFISTMVSLTQYTKICYSGQNMILLVPYTKICYSGHNMILLVPYTKICYSGHNITYTSTPLPLISGTLTSAPPPPSLPPPTPHDVISALRCVLFTYLGAMLIGIFLRISSLI